MLWVRVKDSDGYVTHHVRRSDGSGDLARVSGPMYGPGWSWAVYDPAFCGRSTAWGEERTLRAAKEACERHMRRFKNGK